MNVIEKLKSMSTKKKITYISALLIISILAAAYISLYGGAQTSAEDAIRSDMEKRMSQVLSMVEDAGKVEVVINFSTAEFDVEDKSSYLTSDDEVLEEGIPDVVGVIIVCEGAENISVKTDILRAVSTLLDIPTDKVEILKMN